jgi:hypothetical protein
LFSSFSSANLLELISIYTICFDNIRHKNHNAIKTYFDCDIRHSATQCYLSILKITRLCFHCRNRVVYIQLSTISNIFQLFEGGKTSISSCYPLYKLVFYMGVIAESRLTYRSIKRLLTVQMN